MKHIGADSAVDDYIPNVIVSYTSSALVDHSVGEKMPLTTAQEGSHQQRKHLCASKSKES